ncbi:MAG TPA: class II aldolase/adducin family protein, partial [Fimbriimonas sp.]|nr:class II aldolase/adducin family protein [Fimbriimonas sp.]
MLATALAELSRTIADPAEDCVILGEGNTSARVDSESFLVKASGKSMLGIQDDGFVSVRFGPILAALDGPRLNDEQTTALLAESCQGPLRPSTEAFMHAYLLTLPSIAVVAHTHPTPLLPILCTDACEQICNQRLFPDEIVCCGPSACLVPYAGPGQELAQAIREGVRIYVEQNDALPKTIWIRNHGLICIGATTHEVLTATRMSVKAARAWLGLLQTGFPIRS